MSHASRSGDLTRFSRHGLVLDWFWCGVVAVMPDIAAVGGLRGLDGALAALKRGVEAMNLNRRTTAQGERRSVVGSSFAALALPSGARSYELCD